jgi:hypothetical protein
MANLRVTNAQRDLDLLNKGLREKESKLASLIIPSSSKENQPDLNINCVYLDMLVKGCSVPLVQVRQVLLNGLTSLSFLPQTHNEASSLTLIIQKVTKLHQLCMWVCDLSGMKDRDLFNSFALSKIGNLDEDLCAILGDVSPEPSNTHFQRTIESF